MLADSTQFISELRSYIRQRLDLMNRTAEEDYYVGPVLVEGSASKMIYTSANGFIATHDPMRSNRTVLSKMNHKIIDDKISIAQDPTLSTWNDKRLPGYYTADASGQAPQAVTLVDKGMFRGQLCGRVPSLCTSQPTGNLRFVYPNVGGGLRLNDIPGVIRVKSG